PNEANLRMWNDKSGNYQVQAEFLTVVDGKAHLHKTNGVKIAVPLDKLSPPDIAFIRNIPGYQNISVSKTSGNAGPERPKFDPAEAAATISAKLAASAPPTATVIYNGFNWRDWLLKAGVSSTDATTYAQAFVNEKMDRSVLGDLDRDALKALNVSEGDIIRIRKYASTSVPSGSGAFIVEKERAASAVRSQPGYGKGSAAFSSNDQIRMDEELARELQQQELEGTTGSTSALLKGGSRRQARQTTNITSQSILAMKDALQSGSSSSSPSMPRSASASGGVPRSSTVSKPSSDPWSVSSTIPVPARGSSSSGTTEADIRKAEMISQQQKTQAAMSAQYQKLQAEKQAASAAREAAEREK
ncbi:cytoskeletal protein binding protein, partial [Cladochytrium tenue]